MSTATASEISSQTSPAAVLFHDSPDLLAHPVPRVTRMDNGAVTCHVRDDQILITSDPLTRSGANVRMAIHDARDFERIGIAWCQTYHRIPIQDAPRLAGFLIERPEPICHRLARTIASYADASSALEARSAERPAPPPEVVATYSAEAEAAILAVVTNSSPAPSEPAVFTVADAAPAPTHDQLLPDAPPGHQFTIFQRFGIRPPSVD